MRKFIYGLKSLITKPTRYKFIGFAIPLVVNVIILANKPYMYKEYPVISFVLFYGVIPAYIWFLGAIYKSNNNQVKNKPVLYKNNNQSYDNTNSYDVIPNVSHIERKSVTSNTVTETIYFNIGEDNWLWLI